MPAVASKKKHRPKNGKSMLETGYLCRCLLLSRASTRLLAGALSEARANGSDREFTGKIGR